MKAAMSRSEYRRAAQKARACMCSDHACPHHPGEDCSMVGRGGTYVVRGDYGQPDVFYMCHACASDAVASGVFSAE